MTIFMLHQLRNIIKFIHTFQTREIRMLLIMADKFRKRIQRRITFKATILLPLHAFQ